MSETQSFRLAGSSDIVEIPCDNVHGEDIIYWDDIVEVFPNAQYLKKGNVIVKKLKDSNGKFYPHDCQAGYPIGFPLGMLSNPPPSPHPTSDIRTGLERASSFKQLVETDVQRLVTLPPDVLASSNVQESLSRVLDGRSNQELVEVLRQLRDNNKALESERTDLMSDVKRLKEDLDAQKEEMKQGLDRLALLRNSVKGLLKGTYGLYDSPTPRLFLILPQDASLRSPPEQSTLNLRLYFLCECGEHIKSTNSKIPHHIHLAKHEGYDITRPKEFLRQYGTYALTILRMLKFQISAAGVTVPTLPQLVRVEALDQRSATLKELTNNIVNGVNQAISYIEKVSADQSKALSEPVEQMEIHETLEDTDLRQLQTFLKRKVENKVENKVESKYENKVPGNLYRTITTEGHVKWLCIDHFREIYPDKAAKALRDAVNVLKGSFDENIGRVEMKLQSKVQAEQFYTALEGAKFIFELKLDLTWATTRSDLKRLRDALVKTNVGVLHLDLNNEDAPPSDILNRNHRFEPVIDIMQHPPIKSVTISRFPENFIKRSGLQPHKDEFPNIKHLDIDLNCLKQDISGFKNLVVQAPNLSNLVLRNDKRDFLRFYNAIAKCQTYTVSFPGRLLRILPPTDTPSQLTADFKGTPDLLKVIGGRIEAVILSKDELDDLIIAGFAKATENGSKLKELTLEATKQNLSAKCIESLASIVARSELRQFDIHLGSEVARIRILESIQWKYIRRLDVMMTVGAQETLAMKALVDSAKASRKIELEEFSLLPEFGSYDQLSMPRNGHLSEFVAITSLRKLTLEVLMTDEEVLSLIKSADFSRLQELRLVTKEFRSTSMDAMLDSVQNLAELRFIGIIGATVTDEQKKRMKTKGITLGNAWQV
ncbi:hypothetical protein BGX34_002936 [Mortierella sp. NVP85]|nr:hypothetical protein BGX34_002936 [Mortierella sp. NVP85]